MKFGYIHFDREEQRKFLAAIDSISASTEGAIDELGIGRIRDLYSNKMFPGISSLQRRAKYFIVMPLLYAEACKYSYRNLEDVKRQIRCLEVKLTMSLRDGSPEGTDGITGINTIREGNIAKYVKYDPHYIYSSGLRTFGILQSDDVENLIFQQSKLEKTERVEATSDEDGDAVVTENAIRWCKIPEDLPYSLGDEKISMSLTKADASYLKNSILNSDRVKGSLLHYILENDIDLSNLSTFEKFKASKLDELPDEHQKTIVKAWWFSRLVEGLYIRYNCVLQNGNCEVLKKLEKKWEKWLEDFEKYNELMKASVAHPLHDNGSATFCYGCIEKIKAGNVSDLDDAIRKREFTIKGARHKIGDGKTYDHQIHDYALQYRWGIVRTIVTDIREGLSDGR